MQSGAWLRQRAQSHPAAGQAARLLLAEVLACTTTALYTAPERELDAAQEERLQALWQRYVAGEPLAYLCGYEIFCGLRLRIDAAVLAPRPETEELVALALALDLKESARVLDLGTGSGAIAIALAQARQGWRVTAVEQSLAAAGVAAANIADHGGRVRLLSGDWYQPLAQERFDLIVANPPYIGEDEPEMATLQHEPRGALVAAEDGMAALRHITALAPQHLLPGGSLLLEHGWRQGAAVRAIFAVPGWTQVQTQPDLSGHERFSGARWRG